MRKGKEEFTYIPKRPLIGLVIQTNEPETPLYREGGRERGRETKNFIERSSGTL